MKTAYKNLKMISLGFLLAGSLSASCQSSRHPLQEEIQNSDPCLSKSERERELYFAYKIGAERGESEAQYNLGNYYFFNRQIKSDNEYNTNLFWFYEISEPYFLNSPDEVDKWEREGNGVSLQKRTYFGFHNMYNIYPHSPTPEDYREAGKWYEAAASQGHLRAMVRFGEYCWWENNPEKAVALYRQAAEQGEALAQGALGNYYYSHSGEDFSDKQEALHWYLKAAHQGLPIAQYWAGLLYAHFPEVTRGIRGIIRDEKEAERWFREAAEGGLPMAQCHLGVMYATGEGGVLKDEKEAVRWFSKAPGGEEEFWKAWKYRRLTYIYRGGFGVVSPDPEKVKAAENELKLIDLYHQAWRLHKDSYNRRELFKEPADPKEEWDRQKCREWYEKNYGLEAVEWYRQNYIKAMELYRKASALGHMDAPHQLTAVQYALGRQYYLAQRYPEAMLWFSKASERGHMQARYWIATMYQNGAGVSRNLLKTNEWLSKIPNQQRVLNLIKEEQKEEKIK